MKDTERQAKKRGLTGKEVKDLNAFAKDKIAKTIKERDCNMHAMSDFDDISLSSKMKAWKVSSVTRATRNLAIAANRPTRSEAMVEKGQGIILRIKIN